MSRALPVAVVLFALSACVFRGQHERVQVQLDATQMAMSARAEQCQNDIQALEERISTLDQEIALRQVQLDELAVRTTLRDGELSKLQEERVALAVLLERTLEENRALKSRVEALERRRRRRPVANDPAEDAPPADPARMALAELQGKLEEDFREKMAQQFLDRSHEQAIEAFGPLVEAGYAEILRVDMATVVRIPTGKLFQEGQSVLSPRGEKIVTLLAGGMATIPGRDVSIEAHTSQAPTHSAQFPSNWEKAFGRAAVVLHALEAQQVHARLSATSFAGTRPLVDGGGEVNRRVELVITTDPGIADRFSPTPEPEPEPEVPSGEETEAPEGSPESATPVETDATPAPAAE